MSKRVFVKGEKYRPVVTVAKQKKGIPTVVEMSGRKYTLQHENQFKRGGKKNGITRHKKF